MIAYLLTDLRGRETYMIQGVRSSRSKGNKAAFFQPMFLLEFEGVLSPHAQMHRMKEVQNLIPLRNIVFDVRKSTISLFMAEVIYRMIREEEANPPLFDFICSATQALEQMEEGVSNFHLWFLVQFSAYLGFYPGNEYTPGSYFNIQSGLFCPSMPAHMNAMKPDTATILGELMSCEANELGRLQMSYNDRQKFLESLLSFFSFHFDSIHSVQSLKILREVFM